MLCSRRMLSRCRSSSSFRHCCMVPCGACHWHRYIFCVSELPSCLFWWCFFPLLWCELLDLVSYRLSGGECSPWFPLVVVLVV